MRFIDKNPKNEPQSLKDHIKTLKNILSEKGQLWDYEKDYYKSNPPLNKIELREALLKEQGFLCCYCMRSIENNNKTKVEHYFTRGNTPPLSLCFMNMLAACCGVLSYTDEEGNTIEDNENSICDTKRGRLKSAEAQILQINPFGEEQMARIKFSEGRVEIDDADMQNDLDVKLNLNHQTLVENRQAKLEVIRQEVAKTFPKAKMITKAYIQQKINNYSNPDANGKLKEYCQVYIYWLKQRESKAI